LNFGVAGFGRSRDVANFSTLLLAALKSITLYQRARVAEWQTRWT
jgi:hypothetical protein